DLGLREVDLDAALHGRARLPDLVLEIGVAGVPAIHRARQADAVGIPVQQVEGLRRRPLHVAVDDIAPDPIVASRSATDDASMSRPISPVSVKSIIVVSSVSVASLSSPRAASTPAAQLMMVPPTQKPSAWRRSTLAMSRTTSIAFSGPRLR